MSFTDGLMIAIVTSIATTIVAWFVMKDNYRKELYSEKLIAYKLIHDTIGQVCFYGHLAVKKPEVYEDAWKTSKYNLTIDLFQNELVVSGKVAKLSVIIAQKDIEYIAGNKKAYFEEMWNIFNQMRRELATRLLQSVDSPLVHMSPENFVAHFSNLSKIKEGKQQRDSMKAKQEQV